LFRRPFLLVLGIPVLLFTLHYFQWIDFREQDAIDLRFRLRGEKSASPEITLIEIDDASIAAVGQWPWPRSVHAVLLEVLSRFNPSSIFFDVLFTESSPDPPEDEKLSFAVKKSANIILPFYYYSEKPFGAFFPIRSLREAARGTGYVNVEPDRDGRLRHARAYLETGKETFYHPAVLWKSFQLESPQARHDWLGRLPLDRRHYFWINYPGPIHSYKRIPFGQVIAAVGTDSEAKLKELFENQIVIIGHTATGTTDLKATPFTATDPGISIQAAIFHTLVTEKFLRSSHEIIHFFILMGLALLIWQVTTLWTPIKGLIFSVCTALAYGILNFLLFLGAGWILPLVVPFVTIGLCYITTLFVKYLEVRFQGELIRRELTTAARIQEAFLPQEVPQMKQLDVAFACKFAKQVGGDLYDWLDLGQGRLSLCIGDVSGKGVPAALYMAKAMSDFRGKDRTDLAPGKVCENLNGALVRGGASGMFLTFFYTVIDAAHNQLLFSNAGHEHMIFYDGKREAAQILKEEQGRPLGLFEESDYPTLERQFQKGDAFLLLSDGVKELRSPKGEEFGVKRLKTHFEKGAREFSSSDAIIRHLFQEMEFFRKDSLPHDDRTLVCVRYV